MMIRLCIILLRVTLSLRILNVGREDFGNYTCKATNSYGSSEKTMLLYGMPILELFSFTTLTSLANIFNSNFVL